MKNFLSTACLAITTCLTGVAAQPDFDPSQVNIYVTPYYNSAGPVINVGGFSAALASKSEDEFIATIGKMKGKWDHLSFLELYVASIRLYESGYRKEAVYWFYSAQYRGRQFGMLLDRAKMGGIGDPAFELLQAHNAFYETAGTYLNGYAFGDTDSLIKIVERVQNEGRHIPDLKAVYRNVAFANEREWEALNSELANGMSGLVAMLKEKKDHIRRQRIEQGIEAKFSGMTSKELPR